MIGEVAGPVGAAAGAAAGATAGVQISRTASDVYAYLLGPAEPDAQAPAAVEDAAEREPGAGQPTDSGGAAAGTAAVEGAGEKEPGAGQPADSDCAAAGTA